MNGNPPILVSRPEAARRLGYSLATLKRMVRTGVLEEVRPGPGMHPRVRLEDVLALAEPKGTDTS